MQTPERRSFWALIVTQFFGAFNDNVLKVLVQLLVVELVMEPFLRAKLVNMATVMFDIPFLMFSMIAGRAADRMSKTRVIRGVQIWQLFVVASAVVSLLAKNIPAMMTSLFLLAMQAAFFSPAKYGILPELMDEKELSQGNGILNMATFVAILIGTVAGSLCASHVWMACVLLVLAAVGGLIGSFFIEPLPAVKPGTPWAWNPISDLIKNWKIIRQDRALKLGIIAVNYFWFMGAILLTNIFLYAKVLMNASPQQAGYLLISVTIGIAVGSLVAGRLSGGKVELGLVPIGALGMSLFLIDMLWSWSSIVRTLGDLFLIGFFAGLYEIPLNAMIQWRSPNEERGKVLATQNFLSFVAILIGSGVLGVMTGRRFHLDPSEVLFVLGIVSLAGTLLTYLVLPASAWRLILYILTNTLYRIKIVGGHHVPSKGPALLVSNHLSLADGFLVGGAIPRLVRFLMWRPYFEAKGWSWLMRTMKAIPISDKDSPKDILRSLMAARKALEEGDLVCIFAEGQISRTGNLLEFKKGFEVIVKGMDVPVIPVHLDRVWGSIFSFEHGEVLFKRPRKIPYPVTVTFGEPMKPPVTSSQVRQAVLDLGADAFAHRLEEKGPLAVEFLKMAKRQPRALAVGGSTGSDMSYGRLAVTSTLLANRLREVLSNDLHVGVLLPASGVGALANVALQLDGRVAVNLNYTAGAPALTAAVEKAGLARILTSRKMLEKSGLPAMPSMVYIEDLLNALPKADIIRRSLEFALLPTAAVIRRFAPRGAMRRLDDTATIMFSSGSTGVPKGVMLSHKNILANILGLSQVFDVGPRDRMIGVLPFFHSFGFTATLWFPLISGFSAIYHTNPLDAKTVGELAGRYRATMLLATPTFLLAYIRKCEKEQFQWMRFVIVGAERLRESVAKAFEEKFGVAPLEGYGCTELSPVATANVPDVSMGEIAQTGHKAGMIGQPIPGVSVKVVSPDSYEPLPLGEKGLLLVKGLNVMQGYLGEPEKTAQVIRDGWYVTGDIARIDAEGFVQIVDRLNRFSKIGGEMVPHVLIEEKLHQLAGRTEATFVVTSVPDEKRGEQLVVLYAPWEGDTESLCKKLQESDLPKLWIPAKDNFFSIQAIPYLGTGKLDLATVKSQAQEKMASRPQG